MNRNEGFDEAVIASLLHCNVFDKRMRGLIAVNRFSFLQFCSELLQKLSELLQSYPKLSELFGTSPILFKLLLTYTNLSELS